MRCAQQHAVPETSRTAAGELLTAFLVVATYGAWAALTFYWEPIPAVVLLPLGGYCLALFSSLQHEAIHGHPTPSRRLNLAMVWLPITLWLPLSVYESSHRAHHGSELTLPAADPESWYIAENRWRRMGPAARVLWQFNNTFIGRMLIGPWIAAYLCWRDLATGMVSRPANAGIVASHAAGVAVVLWWVVGVCGMPVYVYLIAFVWPGISVSLVRSFVEHRYHVDPRRRTAIVRGSPLTRLLFLNNNYHVVHHRYPNLAWYRIPRVYRANAAEFEQATDGFSFANYGEIARRYLLRPWSRTVFPEPATPPNGTTLQR